jgi:hypothetical protein
MVIRFFRALQNPLVRERRVLPLVVGQQYRLASVRLFSNETIDKKNGNKDDKPFGNSRCLIIDDTELPKTEKRVENVGKVFSHVIRQHLLGFKALFLGYFDGKSFFPLDFSLYGEKDKNKKKSHGLTKTELNKRFSKKRD